MANWVQQVERNRIKTESTLQLESHSSSEGKPVCVSEQNMLMGSKQIPKETQQTSVKDDASHTEWSFFLIFKIKH